VLSHRPDAAATGTTRDPWARRVLAAALVVAAVRLVHLGTWSLWLDEVYTFTDARNPIATRHPLGYRLFAAYYGLLGGTPGEAALRLPSALAGWLCVPLCAWALRPLVGRRAAAVAALFVALSPWHVYWSQNARFYTSIQALGLAGGGLVVRGLLGGRAAAVLGGGACLAVAALVHPTAALLGAGLLVAPWLVRAVGAWPAGGARGRAWTALGGLAVAAVFGGSLWMLDIWRGWERRQGEPSLVHLVLSLGYLFTPMLGLALVVGAWRALRARRDPAWLLLAIDAVALGAALGASLFLRVSAQYVFVLLPWLAGLAALPFVRMAGHGPRRGATPLDAEAAAGARPGALALAGLALVVAPLAVETGLYFGWRHGDRPRWREAYRHVFENRRPTDLVLGMQAPVAEYYLAPTTPNLRRWTRVTPLDAPRAQLPERWARYGRRTWFVVNAEQLEDWPDRRRDEMRRLIDEELSLQAAFEVPWTPRDLDVRVYLWNGSAPP